MSYRPSEPFTTPIELLNVSEVKTVRGVDVPVYPEKGETIFCSFKTYGGTETTINGVLSVIQTANVETWYRPDITSSSRLRLGSQTYEVMGDPEDIEQRHQFLKFKVRGVKGGT